MTCFHLVKTPEGQLIKIADLVDDDPTKRERVSKALKDPAQKKNRDHVDLIIALGMAKEGFDWIWREHALTVGYRASLTEIVQIIGRATRDAKGKTRSRFADRRLAQKADAFILSTRSNQRETLARFEHENEVVLTFNKHRSFEVIAAGEDECRSFLAEQEPQDGLDMANLLEFQPEEA